ncbi:TPA: hypothetical protein ONZ36_002945 [Enterococcus faecium]|nr:hypothetical protein [Enterococcus faecium]
MPSSASQAPARTAWLTYSKPVDENDGEPISAPSWTFSSNALAAKKAYNP